MKRIVPAIAIVLMLAGCATHTPAPKPFTTHYGESAVTLADHINGCKNVTLHDPGAGTQTGLASVATCTLDGRKITIDSYTDADAANVEPLVESVKKEQFWSEGTGWTAFETDDSWIQYQITNDTSSIFGEPSLAPDLNGEKTAAKKIATALGGHVIHFTP